MKHPALLYSNHHVTDLMVRNCPVRFKHNGVKETLVELQTRYMEDKSRWFLLPILLHLDITLVITQKYDQV